MPPACVEEAVVHAVGVVAGEFDAARVGTHRLGRVDVQAACGRGRAGVASEGVLGGTAAGEVRSDVVSETSVANERGSVCVCVCVCVCECGERMR